MSQREYHNIKCAYLSYFLVSYLACEHKVGVHGHCGAVGDEVGDGLHDIPGVLPPGQSSQNAKLGGHVRHAAPQHPGGTPLCLLTQLLLHLHIKQEDSHHTYTRSQCFVLKIPWKNKGNNTPKLTLWIFSTKM